MHYYTILMIVLLIGCSADIPPDDYFPLQAGIRWDYRVSQQIGDNLTYRNFSIENRGPVALSGKYQDEQVSIRRTSDGTDYYILRDTAGSYRIGKRSVIELKPQLDSEERKILPDNTDIAIGLTWRVPTRPYLLHPRESYSLPDPREKTINMQFEVTGINQKISVLAGVFNNCIEIKASGTVTMYADPRIGYVDVPVTQTEWYAPGVGLIKMVRDEPLTLNIYEGGKVTFELEKISK